MNRIIKNMNRIINNKKGYYVEMYAIFWGIFIAFIIILGIFTGHITKDDLTIEANHIESIKPQAEEVRAQNEITVNKTDSDKNLWEELKVQVISGIIVSGIGFILGQVYSKIKYKKEVNNKLKTLNFYKSDI